MPLQNPNSIGNLLIQLGYCTMLQIKEGLDNMNGTYKLGEVLVVKGYLTQHQLEWALTYQSMERKEVNGAEVHAFVRRQHTGLIDDLRDITVSVRELTAKINAKG